MSAITEALRVLDSAPHWLARQPYRQARFDAGPEHLVLVDDFPRTPAGKILKTELRKRVRALEASPATPAAEEHA